MNEPSNRIIFGAMRHETYYDLLLFFISANSSYREHRRIMSGLFFNVNNVS
jgi:hypothetical protein